MRIQENPKFEKMVKHTANAAAVGAGLAVTTKLAKNAAFKFDCGLMDKFGRVSYLNADKAAGLPLKSSKMYERVMKYANKLFPENGIFHKGLNNLSLKIAGREAQPFNSFWLRQLRGKSLIVGVASAAALAIVGAGIYIAGKINGKD